MLFRSRRLWVKEEDDAITDLVNNYGDKKWTLISRKLQDQYHIYGRYGKQCRERYISFYYRWNNHLNPNINKEPLSPEEEKIVFDSQRQFGNKWANIAKLLPRRTDNIVKNYFYSALRKEIRHILRKLYGENNEPEEVSTSYIQKIMRENHLDYSNLENENVRELIRFLDQKEPEEDSKHSSTYYFLFNY